MGRVPHLTHVEISISSNLFFFLRQFDNLTCQTGRLGRLLSFHKWFGSITSFTKILQLYDKQTALKV